MLGRQKYSVEELKRHVRSKRGLGRMLGWD